jgi:deoxycytidine triphosphate deaminase
MYGNLINNRQIKSLVKSKIIEITPFRVENLSTAHFTIHVGKVFRRLDDGTLKTIHDFSENDNPYTIKGKEYVVIESFETIKLNDENIVGHFVPASNLIRDGLSLTAGKIDKKFGNLGPNEGRKPEMIEFGLINNTNESFLLEKSYRVAHLELYDLRGVASEPAKLTQREKLNIAQRWIAAQDDGVNYDEG